MVLTAVVTDTSTLNTNSGYIYYAPDNNNTIEQKKRGWVDKTSIHRCLSRLRGRSTVPRRSRRLTFSEGLQPPVAPTGPFDRSTPAGPDGAFVSDL